MSLASRLKSGWYRVDQPKPDLDLVDNLPAHDFVDLAYQVILGRKADPYGLQHHTEQLSTGRTTRNQLVYELSQSPDFKALKPDIDELTEEDFVSLTYQVMLGRRATAQEVHFYGQKLQGGKTTQYQFLLTLSQSREYMNRTWSGLEFWLHLHRVRLIITSQLPRAERIIDLGGSSQGNPQGALMVFGYPYHFTSLSIVELPRKERHKLYTEICGEYNEVIQTPQGPVNYVYTSMSDLSSFADNSADLVYAGQSIEHVTVDEAKLVFREVHRVLKPGGHFCFDTPNRKVTILQFPNYVVADHKYEYTHQEMVELLEGHGFAIREAKGLVLMDQSVRENRFIEKEVMGRDRLYDDIENCFLLYYKAQKVSDD